MRTLLVSAVASVLACAVGCDSRPPLDPKGAGGAVATGEIAQPAGASACDRPNGDRLRRSSLAELQQALRVTWQLCSHVGLFPQPQAGMFIGLDDRYVFLELVGGKLVAKTGLQNKGHLEYPEYDISQVNFVSDMEDTTITAAPPILSDDPRQLIINNEGVEIYTYAAVPSATTQDSGSASVTGAGGTTGPGGAAGATGTNGIAQTGGTSACDRPKGDQFWPSSLDELQQTFHGTWQLCSNVGLFEQQQAGMFIGPDDRYVFLELVGGKLVPKTGFQNKGHLEYLYMSQVNFVSDMGGTIVASPPIFSDDPRQFLINNQGFGMYTYGRVP
jgi:hypothetical protein